MKSILENKAYLFLICLLLGILTSFSLPPYNLFFINFRTMEISSIQSILDKSKIENIIDDPFNNRSYYVPSKIYCNELDNFDYWLSKKRIVNCARELNASLLSRGVQYLKGLGINE